MHMKKNSECVSYSAISAFMAILTTPTRYFENHGKLEGLYQITTYWNCRKEDFDLLFPGVDVEAYALSCPWADSAEAILQQYLLFIFYSAT